MFLSVIREKLIQSFVYSMEEKSRVSKCPVHMYWNQQIYIARSILTMYPHSKQRLKTTHTNTGLSNGYVWPLCPHWEGGMGTFPSLKFPITRKITDFDYRETPHLYRKVNLKTLVDRALFDTGSPYFSFY